MVNAVGRALGQARDKAVSQHLVARLHLTGTTPLAWRLRRDRDVLRTEAEGQAASIGHCWIDKSEVECQAPGTVRDPGAAACLDPLEELRLLMGQVTQEESYRAEITAIAEELRSQLPIECRASLGADEAAFGAFVAGAAAEGVDDVVARLRARTGQEAG